MKISLVTFALFGFALAAAAPEPAADLQRRGYTCTIGGDDLCNTVCKQEGNGNGGSCVDGTCTCK